jgi:class 3 adenylate cyclase
MTKILVVDDEFDLEQLIKQKYRKQIREQSYEFYFAYNGREALEVIASVDDIDMVLSDINMPEMDGLTLLSRISESNPLIKAVIVSAYGDMDNIRIAMNRGAFDFVTKPVDFDDLTLTMEKTIKHARQLKDTLQAIKENNILKMYVDENVLNFMGKRDYENTIMANETVEATVMFIDICGFTAISESESPDTVVKLINTYFDEMVKEIMAQKGYVDKFIGDAIMAVFKGSYHLDRAIDAALAINHSLEKLPIQDDQTKFRPKVSIGINSGEMISGNIGSASLKRLDYTVIGDNVNIAARLQDYAKDSQIIISEKCYEEVKESFQCEKVGEIMVKNKKNPMIVYKVVE